MKLKRSIITVSLLIFALLGTSGCAASPKPSATVSPNPVVSPSPAPTPAPSPSPTAAPQTMNIAVYYLKSGNNETFLVREVHKVAKSEGVAKAALSELISGTVLTSGAIMVLPADTKILGIKIENGLATVDFSKDILKANVGASAEAMGITSIVNTLTEFPTIQKVQFTVEGKVENAKDWWGHVGLSGQPFSRNLNSVYLPVIWVTTPVEGQTASSPITVRGTAMIFEATVQYRLLDSSGKILAEGFTMANAGAPDRGDFEIVVKYPPTSSASLRLEVFDVSPKDGSEINKVVINLG